MKTFLLLPVLLSISVHSQAASYFKEDGDIFKQPVIDNIDKYMSINPNVYQASDQMIMTSYTLHLSLDDNYGHPISNWNVGAYTGLSQPSGSQAANQRGLILSGDRPGATAFQAVGGAVGIINAPHIFPEALAKIKGDLIFPVHPLQVAFSNDKMTRPFQSKDSYLNMEFEASLPMTEGYGTKAIAYFGPNYTLRDTTTKTFIYVGTQIYDSRLTAGEFIMLDGCDKCSGNIIVATVLKPDSKYITPLPDSGFFHPAPWKHFQYFGWRIGHSQLAQMLKDADAKNLTKKKFSLNPADYEVVGFLVGTEVVLHDPSEKFTIATALTRFRVFKSKLMDSNLNQK